MGTESQEVAAFILAGGKSTRMGTDKAFITLDGRTLLARALDSARSVATDVQIVGDPEKFAAFGPVVEDIFRGCGPLGGIHAALRASRMNLNLILAVDLPFVSPQLLQYLVTRARNAPDALVTVPHSRSGWQPLCAVYRPQFADFAENALRKGRYKIDVLFDESRAEVIEEGDFESAGFPTNMFRNLNTPEELAEASQEPQVQK